jgi:hypothetical protein
MSAHADLLNSPCIQIGYVVGLSVFFPLRALDVEVYFNTISHFEAVQDGGSVLNSLELHKVGDGSTIDIFVCFYNKFSCFKGCTALNGFTILPERSNPMTQIIWAKLLYSLRSLKSPLVEK